MVDTPTHHGPHGPGLFSSELLAYHQVSSSSNPIVRSRTSSKSLPFKFCMCFFQCLLDFSVGFSFFMTSEIQLEQLEGENMSDFPFQISLLHYLNVCSYLGASLIQVQDVHKFPTCHFWAPHQPPKNSRPGAPPTGLPQQAHVEHSAHRYFVDHLGSELISPAKVGRLDLLLH